MGATAGGPRAGVCGDETEELGEAEGVYGVGKDDG